MACCWTWSIPAMASTPCQCRRYRPGVVVELPVFHWRICGNLPDQPAALALLGGLGDLPTRVDFFGVLGLGARACAVQLSDWQHDWHLPEHAGRLPQTLVWTDAVRADQPVLLAAALDGGIYGALAVVHEAVLLGEDRSRPDIGALAGDAGGDDGGARTRGGARVIGSRTIGNV